MAYSVHTGQNTALASLTLFSPQPTCEGLFFTRTSPLGDRSVWNEGPYLPFVWTVLKSVAQYQAILTLCGLASADLALVTVTGPDARFNIVRYNATVTLPADLRRQNFRLRNLSIIFSDLVAL
jgi:hypothetical protein